MLDPGVLPVGVLSCILVCRIRCHFCRDLLGNNLPYPVRVFPFYVTIHLIERLDNVAQQVQFQFRLTAAPDDWYWLDLAVIIRKRKRDMDASPYR